MCSTCLFKARCHVTPLIMAADMKLATQVMTQALRHLFDDNLLHPDVATCIQYIPPEDTPLCSRGSFCIGSGRVEIVEFIRYDSPLEAVCEYATSYNTKCLEYLRSGLCVPRANASRAKSRWIHCSLTASDAHVRFLRDLAAALSYHRLLTVP